ncbi:P2Y purinoceptor 1-like [Numida meleagris]|uniref:P2Y purinoceptor 1-like n=1 Tax=Numida meleagris TaxID=8996 RepID=UPI000B3E1559|nr:P2Y purinoceptor 1-like [Numida meleagris]
MHAFLPPLPAPPEIARALVPGSQFLQRAASSSRAPRPTSPALGLDPDPAGTAPSTAPPPPHLLQRPMAANAPLGDNSSVASCSVDAAFAQRFLPSVYLVVTPLGLVGNVLGLCQLHAGPRGPLSLLVGHLGLADLLYVCTLPFLISYYLQGRAWAFGQAWCRLTRGLFHLNLYASIGFLTCISVHRYLGIVHPLRARGRCQAAMSPGRLSAAVWLWVIAQVGPDFAFSKMDPRGTQCHDTTGDESLGAYVPYTAAITVTGFVIPFLIIIGCYCHVVVVLCRSDTVEPGLRRSSIRLVVLVMVLFSVCFLPYHIFRNLNLLSRAWQRRGHCTQAMKDIYVSYQVTRGLASFNSALNPLLYVMTSKDCMSRMRNIHQRAKETLGSIFTWESSNQAHETRNSIVFREQEASEQL